MARCASCGTGNRPGARFCDGCGAASVGVAEGHERRKTVTVLFCDVVGSTALGERLDAESLRGLLVRYFEQARRIVEGHGGTVEKFIGDAVMAVFGVPVVREDDGMRAVSAAVELREAVARIGNDLERAVRSRLGAPDRRQHRRRGRGAEDEWLVTGDAVNVAARLQQAAGPREILLGAETMALVRHAVRGKELAPLAVKGKQHPVAAYRLEALRRDTPEPARAGVPMVGRVNEREELAKAYKAVVEGRRCGLVLLVSAPGLGKSRLAREFLRGIDAKVLDGRCLSYGEGVTYWPVLQIVKQVGSLDTLLVDNQGASDTIRALLGEVDTPTTPTQIAWAVRKLFEAVAETRPLVVLLEDVHWGEPPLHDLLEHITRLARTAPILLLGLARPEVFEVWPALSQGALETTTVVLEPLSTGDTEELVARLAGATELEPGLSAKITAASAGNPLFVEEMLAMLRESGDRDVTVPPTIKALLAARLDQLPVIERTVLERGAIEGEALPCQHSRGAVDCAVTDRASARCART